MAVVNVKSEIAGNVWKIQTKPGDRIEAEGEIMILESMKMEIPVLSPKAGIIKEIKVSEGEAIGEGQLVAARSPANWSACGRPTTCVGWRPGSRCARSSRPWPSQPTRATC